MASIHIPVLAKEVLDLLNIKKGGEAIDCTMGEGGHTKMLLEKVGPRGKVLGIEQDPHIAENSKHEILKSKFSENLTVAIGNFSEVEKIAKDNDFKNPKAILFDLGISSWHYQESGRGFSFGKESEPLSMKLGETAKMGAAEILNQATEKELSDIFFNYGEERKSRLIAKKIIEARSKKRILSVGDFLTASGVKNVKEKARIFQALRIAVNNELGALSAGISSAFNILSPGGRLAVISYHSLEDRIVKNFFKEKKLAGEALILTKKPIIPDFKEVKSNPRSRSAKLRVLEKI